MDATGINLRHRDEDAKDIGLREREKTGRTAGARAGGEESANVRVASSDGSCKRRRNPLKTLLSEQVLNVRLCSIHIRDRLAVVSGVLIKILLAYHCSLEQLLLALVLILRNPQSGALLLQLCTGLVQLRIYFWRDDYGK